MFEVCLLCCMVHVCCMLYVTCCTMAHDGAWWVLHTGDVLYLCCMYTVCMWHACMLHVCCICVALYNQSGLASDDRNSYVLWAYMAYCMPVDSGSAG